VHRPDLLGVLPARQHSTTHWRDVKQSSYNNWSLSNVPSLNGISKTAMVEHFGSDRVQTPEKRDSWGGELISPPYQSISAAMKDTAETMSVLAGNNTESQSHGILTTDQCGCNVHIG